MNPPTADNSQRDDAMWIVTSSFIIFTMQSGFGLLESGLVTVKNEVNIMIKNVVDVVFGGLVFWLVGYGLILGNSPGWENAFVGTGGFMLDEGNEGGNHSVGWIYASFFFQLSFSTTSATIVSGAMVERTKLVSYMIFSCLIVLIHCFPAHWIWAPSGFLRRLGVIHIAGGGVVHIVGGTIGMVSTLFLKPRIGRFSNSEDLGMSSPTNALLGTFMLWWGWLGFNCGSTWGITNGKWHMATRSTVATILSSVGGGVVAILLSYIFTKKCKINFLINGILASLVSITSICALARPWYSILIGAVGSALAQGADALVIRLKIDDPVGVIPVHLIGGIWSMLACGFLAEDHHFVDDSFHCGILFGCGPYLLGIQVLSIVVIMAWSGFWALLFLTLIQMSPLGLRVSPEEELEGADFNEHGIDSARNSFWTRPRCGSLGSKAVNGNPNERARELREHLSLIRALTRWEEVVAKKRRRKSVKTDSDTPKNTIYCTKQRFAHSFQLQTTDKL